MNKYFLLSDFATIYSTRTKADEIANDLNRYIKTLNDDDVLVIDFDRVEAISYSFLDQFLSRIIESPLLKEERIAWAGWSDNLISVIDKSLQRRSCQYSQQSSTKAERVLVCNSN